MFFVIAFAPYIVRVILIMLNVFLVTMENGFSLISFHSFFQFQVQLIRVY